MDSQQSMIIILLLMCDSLFLYLRETEYKGLQLSLDQATSKTTLPNRTSSSSSSILNDSCRTPKSRVSRPKTKARLSPYMRVRIPLLLLYRFGLLLEPERYSESIIKIIHQDSVYCFILRSFHSVVGVLHFTFCV